MYKLSRGRLTVNGSVRKYKSSSLLNGIQKLSTKAVKLKNHLLVLNHDSSISLAYRLPLLPISQLVETEKGGGGGEHGNDLKGACTFTLSFVSSQLNGDDTGLAVLIVISHPRNWNGNHEFNLHSQTNNLFHKIECWFHKF
jgi:hypothetical protein